MKQPASVDVSVLLLFFNRPETFRQVFAEVRKARPARLFLYQDGPRNEQDLPGINACRAIVEDIDWECEVHRKYQEKNFGCDPSGYLSQKWAFSLTDKCVVIEDDIVVSASFIPFCKEMLDRYEHDTNVWMIAGFNTDEETRDVGSDYFFTSVFSIWGWASWRRVIDTWDANYSFLDDSHTMKRLAEIVKQRGVRNDFIPMCYRHRDSGRAHFETIFWSSMLLHSALAIMPCKNLVNNIGATENSTHFATNAALMPKDLRHIFTMRRLELHFPLKHPRYLIEYLPYKERHYRRNAWNNRWVKMKYGMEELWLNAKAGNWKHIKQAVAKRLKKGY